MTVTRRLAAILAADCDEISETGLLVAHPGSAAGWPLTIPKRTRASHPTACLWVHGLGFGLSVIIRQELRGSPWSGDHFLCKLRMSRTGSKPTVSVMTRNSMTSRRLSPRSYFETYDWGLDSLTDRAS